MSNLGFEHTGFHKGFDPVLQIRYHSVLDLKDKTADDIIKNMDGLRTFYQRTNHYQHYL
jgi:peptidoglycan pentaglycine glycine transferase (the second and third glycine)